VPGGQHVEQAGLLAARIEVSQRIKRARNPLLRRAIAFEDLQDVHIEPLACRPQHRLRHLLLAAREAVIEAGLLEPRGFCQQGQRSRFIAHLAEGGGQLLEQLIIVDCLGASHIKSFFRMIGKISLTGASSSHNRNFTDRSVIIRRYP